MKVSRPNKYIGFIAEYDSFESFCSGRGILESVDYGENFMPAFNVNNGTTKPDVYVWDSDNYQWFSLDDLETKQKVNVNDIRIECIFPSVDALNRYNKNECRNVGYLVLRLPAGSETVPCDLYTFDEDLNKWVNRGIVDWDGDSLKMSMNLHEKEE